MTEARSINTHDVILLERVCREGFFPFKNREIQYAALSILTKNAARFRIGLHSIVFLPDRYFLVSSMLDEDSDLSKMQKESNQTIAYVGNTILDHTGSFFKKGSFKDQKANSTELAKLALVKAYTKALELGHYSDPLEDLEHSVHCFTTETSQGPAIVISLDTVNNSGLDLRAIPIEFVTNRGSITFEPHPALMSNPEYNEPHTYEFSPPPNLVDNVPNELCNDIKRLCVRARKLIQSQRDDLELRSALDNEWHTLPTKIYADRPPYPQVRAEQLPTAIKFDYKSIFNTTEQERVITAQRRQRVERREFLHAYYNAMQRWKAGDRSAVFPPGTYKMRILHKARIAETLGECQRE